MALPILDGNQSATTLSTILAGGEHTPAHTVVSLGSTAISNITSAVSGSVVSISNFPATQPISGSISISGTPSVTFSAVSIANFPASQTIAGTVTANDSAALSIVNSSTVTKADVKFTAIAGAYNPTDVASSYVVRPLAASSTGKLLIDASADFGGGSVVGYDGNAFIRIAQSPQSVITIGSLPSISGTITVGAMPNGSLTTRFGTPTTANTAFATSAVTNASRKYLLIQNVTTGSNVITVGIGFTPTTTQGIQLTARAGITFESSYIPTGAVYVLSSVTASNFTILEA